MARRKLNTVRPGVALQTFMKSLGSPAVGAVAAVHAAVIDDGSEQTITTGLTNPPTPRSVTASSAGTTADIKAIQVTVNGTDEEDKVISEVLPVFTVNTATTVEGAKAFKTVTSFVVPAHDDTGATTSLGTGNKLGIGTRLHRNSVHGAYLNDVLEATAPTVVNSSSAIESNTVDLDSALDASEVHVLYAKTIE